MKHFFIKFLICRRPFLGGVLEMQTVADMRGVGVKNRGKSADGLCGRPLTQSSCTVILRDELQNNCTHFVTEYVARYVIKCTYIHLQVLDPKNIWWS